MPSVVATIKKQMLIVTLNAAGDDVDSVRVISTMMKDGTAPIAPSVEKTYTKAEAASAGVTGAQLTAFLGAAETLRANHQTALLGA